MAIEPKLRQLIVVARFYSTTPQVAVHAKAVLDYVKRNPVSLNKYSLPLVDDLCEWLSKAMHETLNPQKGIDLVKRSEKQIETLEREIDSPHLALGEKKEKEEQIESYRQVIDKIYESKFRFKDLRQDGSARKIGLELKEIGLELEKEIKKAKQRKIRLQAIRKILEKNSGIKKFKAPQPIKPKKPK